MAYATHSIHVNGGRVIADYEKEDTSRGEVLALIWLAYRVSLPYILGFAGAMILVTWLITVVFL